MDRKTGIGALRKGDEFRCAQPILRAAG